MLCTSTQYNNHTSYTQQDYRIERKWSAVGFCSGAIAGLVAITPGSGFVGARTYIYTTICPAISLSTYLSVQEDTDVNPSIPFFPFLL